MTRFATFATLFMTAFFLEYAEKWRHPGFTTALLLLGVVLLGIGLTRRTFAIYLAVPTAYALLVQFPDVANHINVEIYCSLLLMVGIVYSLVRSRQFPTDDDCFELVRPLLQASTIVVYVLAGFGKLNTDFLNPEVSCVGEMLGDLARVANGHVLGVPYLLLIAAGVGMVVVALLATRGAGQAVPLAVRVGVLGLILVAAILARQLAPGISPRLMALGIMAMAGVVILWELVGGLLLAVPRLQGALLAFSWTMHATLSLIGFVHFGALALALLFTFVPAAYLDLMTGRLRLPIVGRSVPRAHVYFAVNVLSGIFSGLDHRLVAVALFNLSVLILTWPVLRALVAQAPHPVWPGVSLRNRLTPNWLFVFPVLLLLHGLTSYLGLRTAGNFSMFSNLRTEGSRSNHLLLGGNPLKLWGYQEDVVRLIRIDDRQAAIGDNYHPLQGHQLPVVEFRKWIYAWTRAGKALPMTLEYRGQVHSTENIVSDPLWRTSARDWEMRLMDFRPIQAEGANRCRW